jgi:hypothetical protein
MQPILTILGVIDRKARLLEAGFDKQGDLPIVFDQQQPHNSSPLVLSGRFLKFKRLRLRGKLNRAILGSRWNGMQHQPARWTLVSAQKRSLFPYQIAASTTTRSEFFKTY